MVNLREILERSLGLVREDEHGDLGKSVLHF